MKTNKEKLHFKVSSGLKNIIGRELITGQLVAIFELVKNGYDADAPLVKIIFENNKIIIIDNGIGMNYEDILNKWLFVAYSEKVKKKEVREGKYYVGAKGVGRFSCDRLGSNLTITTKTYMEETFNVIELEWDEFEQDLMNQFVDIPVDYYRTSECEFLEEHGTVIEISNLRDEWNLDTILKLKRSLSKLRDPFAIMSDFEMQIEVYTENILNELEILNSKNETDGKEKIRLNGIISNDLNKILLEKTIHIECSISEYITLRLTDRGEQIYEIRKKNNTILNGINMNVFYLNRPAKLNFTRLMGVSNAAYGSVSIYKNSFRIYPYGEPKTDFFNLDSRKAQGYARHLGNREVLGTISIVDPSNNFKEVSSRDRGFENNIYLKKLEKGYMDWVHKPLEKYVNLVKWGYNIEAEKDILINDIDKTDVDSFVKLLYKNGVSKDDEIIVSNIVTALIAKPTVEQKLETIVQNEHINDIDKETVREASELIKNYKGESKIFEQTVTMQKEEISRLENQTKLFHKLSSDEAFAHAQISHHVGKVSSVIDSKVDDIMNLIYKMENNKLAKEIRENLSIIKYQTSRLSAFKNIALKSDLDTKSKTRINLYDYVNKYINEIIDGIIMSDVYCRPIESSGDWIYDCDVLDISIIIDNLVANAKEAGADAMQIEFVNYPKKSIRIFSNSTPIGIENLDKIFEFGYSTKTGGTGVGLYHIKQIVEGIYKWKITVNNYNNGVIFIIDLGE